jgi:hypothetical protein
VPGGVAFKGGSPFQLLSLGETQGACIAFLKGDTSLRLNGRVFGAAFLSIIFTKSTKPV